MLLFFIITKREKQTTMDYLLSHAIIITVLSHRVYRGKTVGGFGYERLYEKR